MAFVQCLYDSDVIWIDNFLADYTLLITINVAVLHESVVGEAIRHDQELIQALP
jgi:hypothetical protein